MEHKKIGDTIVKYVLAFVAPLLVIAVTALFTMSRTVDVQGAQMQYMNNRSEDLAYAVNEIQKMVTIIRDTINSMKIDQEAFRARVEERLKNFEDSNSCQKK